MSTLTYRAIIDALAAVGITATQTQMGGNVAALTVDAGMVGAEWRGVVIGDSEWSMFQTPDVPLYTGTASVSPEFAGEWLPVPAWDGADTRECNTLPDVVQAVREALAVAVAVTA